MRTMRCKWPGSKGLKGMALGSVWAACVVPPSIWITESLEDFHLWMTQNFESENSASLNCFPEFGPRNRATTVLSSNLWWHFSLKVSARELRCPTASKRWKMASCSAGDRPGKWNHSWRRWCKYLEIGTHLSFVFFGGWTPSFPICRYILRMIDF